MLQATFRLKHLAELLQGNGTKVEVIEPGVFTFAPMYVDLDMYEQEGKALIAFLERLLDLAQNVGQWQIADEIALLLGQKTKPSERQKPI